MDKTTIINTLEILADGCDPTTGEVFPENSPYNQPEIIRTLFHAVDLLKTTYSTGNNSRIKLTLAEKQQVNRDKGLPFNHGLSWSEEDRKQVVHLFQTNTPVSKIALQLGRKQGSIIAELEKQSLITLEQRQHLVDKLRVNAEFEITQATV